MNKLRLLVTPECDRGCVGCCNKDWDLSALPICQSFDGYKEIILTGGEPMKHFWMTYSLARFVGRVTSASIYMYTADVTNIERSLQMLGELDGMTLTLHDQNDVKPFVGFHTALVRDFGTRPNKSLRLNIFEDVEMPNYIEHLAIWNIKNHIVWKKNCPLPEDEVFMRI